MPTFKRCRLIRNPTAGVNWSHALRQRVLDRLMDWIPSIEITTTQSRGHATQLAREAAASGCDLVIAAGGDGTLNEVINGITGSGTAVAFLPSGTGNSIAYSLGLPLHPLADVTALRRGQVREAYLGLADGRYFALMVGIGFDAYAVKKVRYGIKRILGRASYIVSGSGALLGYRYPIFTVKIGKKSYTGSTVVIAKSQYYASRFRMAPDVSLEKPEFQVFIFTGRGALTYLKYVGAVVMNRHMRLSDVISIKANEIQVSPQTGLLAHMDGDVLPNIPAEIRIADERIRILFPG